MKSFSYFTPFLGKEYSDEIINDYNNLYLFNELIKDVDKGIIRFKSPYYDEISSNNDNNKKACDDDDESCNNDDDKDPVITAESYSVEEITSMKLKHIKSISEQELGGNIEITDCVITVPEYWTMKQRQSLLDSAKIAGLNVLGLINENTAAALQYALRGSLNETETIMLYNMGALSTKVSIVQFESVVTKKKKGKNQTMNIFNVLSQSWDETLGTLNFDDIIIKYVINEAKTLLTNKISDLDYDKVLQNPRFTARIKIAANRAKKVLSANNEAFIGIEGIYKDIDYKGTITRDYLYEQGNKLNLFTRANDVMDEALKNGKLNKDNITAIVLIGGGTRIPRIRQILTDYLGKPFRENLNSDEAPAFGACFRAANLSSTFQVRKVPMTDISPFGYGVRLSNLEDNYQDILNDDDKKYWGKRGSLFKVGNALFRRRAVTLHHDKDLRVVLSYENNSPLPKYINNELGYYQITGIEKSIKKYITDVDNKYNITDLPKVSISFLLNADSMVQLVTASATYTEYITETVPKKKSKKKDSNETNSDSNDTDSETTTDDSDSNADETESNEEMETVTKKRTHKTELKVKKFFDFVKTEEEVRKSKKILLELDDRDRSVIDTANARNDLESFIFDSRNRIYDDKKIEKVSTEDERENILKILSETEDWIFDVEKESVGVYKKKLTEDPAFYSREVYMKLEPIMSYGKKLLSRQPPRDWFKKKSNDTKDSNKTDEINTNNDTDTDTNTTSNIDDDIGTTNDDEETSTNNDERPNDEL